MLLRLIDCRFIIIIKYIVVFNSVVKGWEVGLLNVSACGGKAIGKPDRQQQQRQHKCHYRYHY